MILEWAAISYSRDLPDPGIKPSSLNVSCIGRQILYHYHRLGSPLSIQVVYKYGITFTISISNSVLLPSAIFVLNKKYK